LGPHAPGLGEHTKAVLRSAGVPVKEVDRLLKATQTGAEEDEPEEPEE
jgi:hypothetical protein